MTDDHITLHVAPNGRTWTEDGKTPTREVSTATVTEWQVEVSPSFSVTAGLWRWQNGDLHVGLVERQDGPELVDRLKRGLRMSVLDAPVDGASWVELAQARIKNARVGDSNVFKASAAELDDGAGLDVASYLRGLGATRIGTREDLLDDGSRRRGYLAVTFPPDRLQVAVGAYAVTRILPLHRRVMAG